MRPGAKLCSLRQKKAALGGHAGIRTDPRSGIYCDDVAVERRVLDLAEGEYFYAVSYVGNSVRWLFGGRGKRKGSDLIFTVPWLCTLTPCHRW